MVAVSKGKDSKQFYKSHNGRKKKKKKKDKEVAQW